MSRSRCQLSPPDHAIPVQPPDSLLMLVAVSQTFVRELRKQLLLGVLSAAMAIGGMWLFGFPLPWAQTETSAPQT